MLHSATVKLKSDVEALKKREQEKRQAANEALEKLRKEERLALRRADQRREEEN